MFNCSFLQSPTKRTIVSISGKTTFTVQPQSRHPTEKSNTQKSPHRPINLRARDNDSAVLTADDAPWIPTDTRRKTSPNRQLEASSNLIPAGTIVRLLRTRIIKNMTKNGKYQRFSILLAAGNGQGGLGIAHGKAVSAVDAISKATRLAIRSMSYYDRWQNRTIFHDDRVKFKATILYVRPAAPESGRRCHPAVSEMCRCMGIKDISAAVHGSRNPLSVAQAFLLALKRQKTPEQVAQDSGMKIVDVLKVYQRGCEELTRTLRAERYSNDHLKLGQQLTSTAK